jgi:3(or 17)beta-hydroxysteroid dehydrogenase
MPRLKDKIVLVTGAAGAIGAAIVQTIEAEGGTAIGSDLAGRGNVRHALDVTAEGDWARVTAVIAETNGRLDGLVNAAGIVAIGTIEDTDFATWRRVMAINLDGTFLGCKYALPLLKRAGGSIVNISSVSGLVGGHNLAAYNASKGGVRLLTKSVALHGARLKPPVRCNSVHPAFIEGPMAEGMVAQFRDPARAREKLAGSVPLGRFGTPAEVAEMCVYLLSEESAFVTGAEFVLDARRRVPSCRRCRVSVAP